MPRSSILLTPEPVTVEAIQRATLDMLAANGETALGVELRAVDEGAVLQVVAEGTLVLSVLRPRLMPAPAERERILPGAAVPETARWWTEAYTPWRREGAVGLAILDAVAAAGGATMHQG